MRRPVALLAALAIPLAGGSFARAAVPSARVASANAVLSRQLTQGVADAGGSDGAYVMDLATGKTLYSYRSGVGRIPASVEKIYTTSTALLRFGPNARLSTEVLGVGHFDTDGGWHGTLYLKGGGDPTFGSAGFDHTNYGTGATMQQLVTNLIRATGIKSVQGRIVGDESYFDSIRGTAAYGFQPNLYYEGQLSALAYDRGFTDASQTVFQQRPALFATQQFVAALAAGGVKIPSSTPVYTGATPPSALELASVASPKMSKLIQLTNTPSDNFFAEMLLKGIGAKFGGAGSTAAGAAVVRTMLATTFGIHPRLIDGSGLSYYDSTSPRQVAAALEDLANNGPFVNSLAVLGKSGTLQNLLRGTSAQGRCTGKTGTLSDVANMAGYCHARDGHTLVYAFMMNSVGDTTYAHQLEADMAGNLVGYNG